MNSALVSQPLLLPLALCRVPPGLEMMLSQEGVPFTQHGTASARNSAFILFDSRVAASREAIGARAGNQVAIDIASLRRHHAADPFSSIVKHAPARRAWQCGGYELVECAARHDKAALRRSVLDQLRVAILQAGGVWARLAPFPHPYRSAFNFRVDLDEYHPHDYWAFSRARAPLAGCITHFVSTAAYAQDASIMRDLARHDTQSHGHHHHVYRDRACNKRNLRRAQGVLVAAGIEPVGFAAPGGRWNRGLDGVMEELGYRYSSDFQLHCDDVPAYPWVGGRFSRVLQVPIHPVCEGLFFEAGGTDPNVFAQYLVGVLASKVAAGEPVFLYGHPERRLARNPQILQALEAALGQHSQVWRTTLTRFAAWWHQRQGAQWTLRRCGPDQLVVEFQNDATHLRFALEIDDGLSISRIPVQDSLMLIHDASLQRQPKTLRFDAAASRVLPPHVGLKAALRTALDWEKVTPADELPTHTITARWKKRLRLWQTKRKGQ